jgi:hypothetical protein
MGHMVAAGKVLSYLSDFFEKGHTHGIGDQRFSIAGPELARAPRLEDIQAFKEQLEENMPPYKGGICEVRIIDGTWDFHELYKPLDLSIKAVKILALHDGLLVQQDKHQSKRNTKIDFFKLGQNQHIQRLICNRNGDDHFRARAGLRRCFRL